MRILFNEAHFGWDEALGRTPRTVAYTNHTLLAEAFEKWPVTRFQTMLPCYQINRWLLAKMTLKRAERCAPSFLTISAVKSAVSLSLCATFFLEATTTT